MGVYLLRRRSLMVLTLFGMSVLIFVMLRLVPGNISDILFESAGLVNPAEKKKIEVELGLDRPIIVQYWRWVSGLAVGDLGYAYVSEKPAIEEIAPRIPITAKLASMAVASSGVSIPDARDFARGVGRIWRCLAGNLLQRLEPALATDDLEAVAVLAHNQWLQ